MSTRYRKEIYQNWLSALGKNQQKQILYIFFLNNIYLILASFGGLLGLIMGFSIVTAFEFVYFLTFRPVFNYYNTI